MILSWMASFSFTKEAAEMGSILSIGPVEHEMEAVRLQGKCPLACRDIGSTWLVF